jgi:hypothetical protein
LPGGTEENHKKLQSSLPGIQEVFEEDNSRIQASSVPAYSSLYVCVSNIVPYGFDSLRVFENRVLRRISGPKRDEETGDWRKLHNEELHKLYSSPSIIRMIKSGSMRCAGHVARMGEKRNAYWWDSRKEGDHWKGQDVDGWTILKWILEKYNGMVWIGLIWLRTVISGGLL